MIKIITNTNQKWILTETNKSCDPEKLYIVVIETGTSKNNLQSLLLSSK